LDLPAQEHCEGPGGSGVLAQPLEDRQPCDGEDFASPEGLGDLVELLNLLAGGMALGPMRWLAGPAPWLPAALPRSFGVPRLGRPFPAEALLLHEAGEPLLQIAECLVECVVMVPTFPDGPALVQGPCERSVEAVDAELDPPEARGPPGDH